MARTRLRPSAPQAKPLPSAPSAKASQAPRTASPDLVRHWPFGARPILTAYVDLQATVGSHVVGALADAFLVRFGQSLTDRQTRCVRAAVRGARELAVGIDLANFALLARFDPPLPPGCLEAEGGVPVEVAGASEAITKGKLVAAAQGPLVVAGAPALVERALSGGVESGSQSAAVFAPLALSTDQILAADLHLEGIDAHASVVLNASHFRLQIDTRTPSEAIAKAMMKKVDPRAGIQTLIDKLEASGAPPVVKYGTKAELIRLSDKISLTQDGSQFRFAFDVRGSKMDLIREVTMAQALGTHAVRQYILRSKVAMARAAIQRIAEAVRRDWAGKDASPHAKARKKLVSYPPVPLDIPAGVKVRTTPKDWRAWAPLRFSIQEQYFQYEIRAAKDGQSVEIRARGDLDGDDKTSLLSLPLRVSPKDGSLVVGALSEQDPLE